MTVSFNVGRHFAFVAAVNATASIGFNYKPPSYIVLRTILIGSKKSKVEVKVKRVTSFLIETYGMFLYSDGWDNIVHCPLMNIMLYCPSRDIFVDSVDTLGNKKTKEYTTEELKRYIKEIGLIQVSQICTDNAANMLGALNSVVEMYPHIYK